MSGIVGSLNTRGSGLINIGSATDGQVFTGTGAGLPVGFEAAAGGGKLLQVVFSNDCKVGYNTTSTTLADVTNTSDATWETSITPAATSSKILVLTTMWVHWGWATGNETNKTGELTLNEKIGSGSYTSIEAPSNIGTQYTGVISMFSWDTYVSYMHLRTTNTTDAVSYKFQFATSANGNWRVNSATAKSSVTLMEVGA